MRKRFGNYEILRKIAAGGMAEVFLAKQKSLGGFERLVCIKRILPHLSEQEDFIRMFQDEARIVANLNHPNIAQIYDIGFAEDCYYIAMEYVRGEDLRRVYNQEVTRGRAMPLEPASHIIMGAAAGLDFAHRQTSIDGRPLGIVHRDVSPQNILVTYDGHVKLVDFGVAKAEGKLTETRSGVLKGKYSYMSPEQASGDPVDGRTDIFALGITLFEVTTGVRLFKRETEIETLHAVIECNVTPPADLVPGYDEELQAAVLRALAHEPDDRFPTAGEMERAIERFLVRRGHPTGSSSLGAYMQDLFAEKLADEVLFGGPPWEEELTPSRRGPTEPGDEPRRAGSHRSSPNPTAPAAETAIGDCETDNTVIDPGSPVARGSRASRAASKSGPSDWGTEIESVSRTRTQDPRERIPGGAASIAPVPVARRRRSAWPAALVVMAVLATLGVAGRYVWTAKLARGAAVRSGMLAIDSEPRGARVVFVGTGADALNARYQGSRTPLSVVEGVQVGASLTLRLVKEGYEIAEVQVPEVSAGVPPPPIFVELSTGGDGSEAGALIVLSNPAGAEVFVDGNRAEGTTPLNDLHVRGGETHRVEIHLAGYSSRSETVYVEPGSRRYVEVTLFPDPSTPAPPPAKPTADAPAPGPDAGGIEPPAAEPTRSYLTVTSPLKLKVRVDSRYVGETPIRRLAVKPGVRSLRLECESEGFVIRRKVRLAEGSTETVDIKPRKGNLSLNATPWAWVRIGQSSPAETPVRLSVYEGDYDLLFECPDGQRKKEDARVVPGQTTSLSVNCRK